MELLIVILLSIIGLLTFLLLKKERVLGIKPETANKNTEVKIVENKEYRKNIFDLLNSIPAVSYTHLTLPTTLTV